MLTSVTPDTPNSPERQALPELASTTARVVDDPQEWQAFSTPVAVPVAAADPQSEARALMEAMKGSAAEV